MIKDDNQPVILDFGLALTLARPGPGIVAGTPSYMAPEQIEGHRGDQRIDIYALGTILYEMLAGKPPFVAEDPEDIMNKHLYEAIPRLDQVRPDISLQLATVIAKCLQRDPDQRYFDMQQFSSQMR